MLLERVVGDVVDELLGGVQRLGHVLGLAEGVLRDAAADVYDGPEQRLAAYYLGVAGGVGGGRDGLDELEDVGPAADAVELVYGVELVCERDLVDAVPARVEPHHCRVDYAAQLGGGLCRGGV